MPPIASELSPLQQPLSQPLRITTGLLLLWMTTTAVVLAFAAEMQRQRLEADGLHFYGDSPYQRMLWIREMLWFAFAPAYGAALAAAVGAAGRLGTGTRGFPVHPGHWIAVLLGIASLGYVGNWIVLQWLPTDKLVAAATLVAVCVVSCFAASSIKQPLAWRVVMLINSVGMCILLPITLAGQAGGMAVLAIGMLPLYALPAIVIAVAALAALVVATGDILLRKRFDLFHWLGLLTLGMIALHPVIAVALLWWR